LIFWLAILAAVASLATFVAWFGRGTAKAHASFAPEDVEAALSELLDPQAVSHDGWDLFLGFPINDPYLESIRQECIAICRECPPAPGKDINEEGEARVAALLADLRRRTNLASGLTRLPRSRGQPGCQGTQKVARARFFDPRGFALGLPCTVTRSPLRRSLRSRDLARLARSDGHRGGILYGADHTVKRRWFQSQEDARSRRAECSAARTT
jgi:hypothetical protein